MIDKRTGVIRFNDPRFEIGPGTTRAEFLACSLGRQSRDHVVNEPWHSYALPHLHSGIELAMVLFFNGDQLEMVQIEDADDRFGTCWENYKPFEQKKSHDRWLKNYCGIRRRGYRWGSVASVFDDRGGFSCIVVRYGFGQLSSKYRRDTLAWGLMMLAPYLAVLALILGIVMFLTRD